MSNNTQTLAQTSGDSTTQLKNTQVPVQKTPDTVTNGGFVDMFRQYLPDRQYDNGASLRSSILNNPDVQNELVNNIISSAGNDDQFKNLATSDPNALLNAKANVRKFIVNGLSQETALGQDMKTTLVNRAVNLRFNPKVNKDIFNLPLGEYKNIIEKNKNEYKNFDLFDSKGNFLYQNDTSDKALTNLIIGNKKLQTQLIDDHYKNFENLLNNTHNQGGIDQSNPTDMAQAYAIFDEYGSEGLTQFINYKSSYDPNVPVDEQSAQAKSGFKFMAETTKHGITPVQYIEAFIGSKDSPLGQLVYNPPKRSMDLDNEVPRDLNAYTSLGKYNKSGAKKGFDQLLSTIAEDSKTLSANSIWSMGDWLDKNYGINQQKTDVQGIAAKIKAGTLNEKTKPTLGNIILEQYNQSHPFISTIIKGLNAAMGSNTYHKGIGKFLADAYQLAQSGNGPFNINDLIKTVASNGTYKESPYGTSEYVVDYNKADPNVKLAIDILKQDTNIRDLFVDEGNGKIGFIPDLYTKNKAVVPTIVERSKQNVPMYDKNGNLVGFGQTEDNSLGSTIGSTIGSFIYGAAQFADNAFLRPGADAVSAVLQNIGAKDLSTDAHKGYYEWIRPQIATDVSDKVKGILPNVGLMAGNMIPYMISASSLGKSILSAPGEFFETLAEARKIANISAAGDILAGDASSLADIMEKPTLFERYATTLRNMINNGNEGVVQPKFFVGSSLLEALHGGRQSMFGTGLADQAMKAIGAEEGNNIQAFYNAHNRLVQIGTDAIGMEAVATLFDSLVALGRGVAGAAGKEVGGLKYLADAGEYEKVNKFMFNPEWRRFFHNFINEASNADVGNMKQAFADYASDPNIFRNKNYTTIAHAITSFTNEVDPLMQDAPAAIRKSYEGWNVKYGNNSLTSDAIDALTNETVNNMKKSIAENMYGLLSSSEDQTFPFKFSQALKNASYSVTPVEGVETLGLPDAVQYKLDNPNHILKQIGENEYQAFQVTDKKWSTDLAERIQSQFFNANKSDIVDSHMKADGIFMTENPTKEGIQSLQKYQNILDRWYGQTVQMGEETGKVVDVDNTGLYVLGQDGTLHKGVKFSDVELEQNMSDSKYKAVPNGTSVFDGKPQPKTSTTPAEGTVSPSLTEQQKNKLNYGKVYTKLEQNQDLLKRGENITILNNGKRGEISSITKDGYEITYQDGSQEMVNSRKLDSIFLKKRPQKISELDITGNTTNPLETVKPKIVQTSTSQKPASLIPASPNQQSMYDTHISGYKTLTDKLDEEPNAYTKALNALVTNGEDVLSQDRFSATSSSLSSEENNGLISQINNATEQKPLTLDQEINAIKHTANIIDIDLDGGTYTEYGKPVKYESETNTFYNKEGLSMGTTSNFEYVIRTPNDNTTKTFYRIHYSDGEGNPLTSEFVIKGKNLPNRIKNAYLATSENEGAGMVERLTVAQKAAEAPTVHEIIQPTTSDHAKKWGVSLQYWRQISNEAGYKGRSKAIIRKIVKLIGLTDDFNLSTIGKNKEEIDYLDVDKVRKSGIPKDIVFKVNRDGIDEYYITQKAIPKGKVFIPMTWMKQTNESGMETLSFNPYIKKVGKNVTTDLETDQLQKMSPVVQDGKTWYYFDKNGTTVLNIQKPLNGEEANLDQIYQQGIDGFYKKDEKYGDMYRPINEPQQAFDITQLKNVSTKNLNNVVTFQGLSKDDIKNTLSENADDLRGSLHMDTSMLWGGVLGYMGGELLNHITGEDKKKNGFDFGVLGAILGAGLMSRQLRTMFKGSFRGAADEVTNVVEHDFGDALKADMMREDSRKAELLGFDADVRDQNTVNEIRNLWSGLQGTKNRIGEGFKNFLNSQFAQSAHSFLTNLQRAGIESAGTFRDAIMGYGKAVEDMISKPILGFNTAMGDNNAYWNLMKNGREQIVKEALSSLGITDEMKTEELQKLFNKSFARILDTGGHLDELGNLKVLNDVSVSGIDYSQGNSLYDLDQALMNNDTFHKFILANRDAFSEVNMDAQIALNKPMYYWESKVGQKYRSLATAIVNTDYSLKDFKASLSDENKVLFKEAQKQDSQFQELLSYKRNADKYTNLDRQYLPQIQGTSNQRADFLNFLDNNPDVKGLDVPKQVEAYKRDLAERTFKLNYGSDNIQKRILRYFDEDGDFETMSARSEPAIKRKLSQYVNRYAQRGEKNLTEDEISLMNRMINSPDDFIKSERQYKYDENNQPILTPSGRHSYSTKYWLEAPDDVTMKQFTKSNSSLFVNEFYNNLDAPLAKKSNFLENSRFVHMPLSVLEDDPYRMWQRYARDVAPRLQNMNNGMFDSESIAAQYIDPIIEGMQEKGFSPQEIQKAKTRLVNSYNVANNVIKGEGDDLLTAIKERRASDIIRDSMMMRFGYGFGWYNMYQWLGEGMHFSSFGDSINAFKSYSVNPEYMHNMMSFLKNHNIIRNEIEFAAPGFEHLSSLTANPDMLSSAAVLARKGAQFSANFSFTRLLGEKLFGYDLDKAGISRLFTDGFIGNDMVASSITAEAALSHVNYLANVANEMLDQGVKILNKDGKTFTMGDIERQLKLAGIDDNRIEGFIKDQQTMNNFIEKFHSTKPIDMEYFKNNPEMYNDLTNILNTTIENYHGTNKLLRPEWANSPIGSLFYQYAIYPFNIAYQTVQRRIRVPIQDWVKQYGGELGIEGEKARNALFNTSVYSMLSKLRNGDIEGLHAMGLSDEAIHNIPVDAFTATLRQLGTLGISTAGFITLGAVNDILSYPLNSIDGQEQWHRLKSLYIVNPNASKKQQWTWGDIHNHIDLNSFWTISNYFLGLEARAGMFGKWGDFISNRARMSKDGIVDVFPSLGLANDAFKSLMKVTSSDLRDIPITATNELSKQLISWTPIIGSSIFSSLRNGVQKQIQLTTPNAQLRDATTGKIIKWTDIRR